MDQVTQKNTENAEKFAHVSEKMNDQAEEMELYLTFHTLASKKNVF